MMIKQVQQRRKEVIVMIFEVLLHRQLSVVTIGTNPV
jgi:hypothetical protein